MEELFSWELLGTLTGATACVLIITQYIKPLLPKLNTRLIALILATIILVAVTAVTRGEIADYGLALLNAILVASTAMGAYQVTFAPVDERKKETLASEEDS